MGLTEALFGDKKTKIDKEVEDTIGEFTNMICGDARRRMAEHGVSMEAGLPTVVSSDGHTLSYVSAGFSFIIPFTSPHALSRWRPPSNPIDEEKRSFPFPAGSDVNETRPVGRDLSIMAARRVRRTGTLDLRQRDPFAKHIDATQNG